MPSARCCGYRLDRRLAVILVLATVWAATPGSRALGEGSNAAVIGEHIQHIRGALLPAVIVKGEREKAMTLSDRMAALHVPGVSIAVIHEGKLEWARGFGVSKIGGPEVTPNTLFQAASISKPVTAMGVLHWVQMGKLELDVDVNRSLKSWRIPSNSFTDQKPVTLRELLSHTAGMTVHGFPGYAGGVPLPTLGQILDGLPPANTPAIRVDVVPGTIWRYSGGGFVVAQQLLEDVTGEPFARVMQEAVLRPIGMSHSSFEQPLPPSRLAKAAIPYGGAGTPIKGGPHVYPEMAPAGLWTTPSDLARFALEIQRSLRGQSNRVLSVPMTQQMLTRGLNDWGLGLRIVGGKQHPAFEHSGANAGYQCELTAYNAGDGAVVMTNGDNGIQLAEDLRRTIAHEYGWPDFQPKVHRISPVDPERMDLLTGTYQLEPNSYLTISRDGDHLYSQATGQGRIEIFSEAEYDYFAKTVDAQLTFDADKQGRAARLVLHQYDQDRPATRLGDAAAKPIAAALAAINKRFHDQTPAPGSESALRELIIDLAAGTPNYDKLGPEMGRTMREQVTALQSLFNKLGAVQSMRFKEVTPGGSDIYRVMFAKGTAECGLTLQADGTISDAGISSIEQ